MKTVFISAKPTPFERQLVSRFYSEGYKVFVSGLHEPCEKIDIYIDVTNRRERKDKFSIRDGLDETIMRRVYRTNVQKSIKMLEKYLPLLDKGEDKRLCFISGVDASINETKDTYGYAYKMSKAAMHNLFMIAWNTLEKDGYTFRVYDPLLSEVKPVASAEGAFTYFTSNRGTENDDPLRNDENRLVLRDALGREHTW